MTDIKDNLTKVLQSLPDGVRLVAVSKFHAEDEVLMAYEQGQRVFGESHERELARKHDALPKDIQWHFIGHLQTNKVRLVVPYISMIQAVDSVRLFREIEKQAARHDRVVDCLIELHIAKEDSKYGFTLDECRQFLADGEWRRMTHVRIRGLMMMASFVDDEQQIRQEMMTASDFFDELKRDFFADDDCFSERSWGMSDDYHIAVQCNSTMVRVGTVIFGPRTY